MKTPEEIEELKKNWIKDPCWDIEQTEGFEDHKQELKRFRKMVEIGQKFKRDRKVNLNAIENGVSFQDQGKIEDLEYKRDTLKRQAKDLFVHYLSLAGAIKKSDHIMEAEVILDNIYEAVEAQTKIDIIKSKYHHFQ